MKGEILIHLSGIQIWDFKKYQEILCKITKQDNLYGYFELSCPPAL